MDLITALSLVLVLFVTLLATVFGYLVILLLHLHAKYDHLPGPKRTSFFLGNITEFAQRTRTPEECVAPPADHQKNLKPLPYEVFGGWFNEHGDTCVIFLLHRPLILTRDRNVLKTILVSGDPKNFPKTESVKIRVLYGQRYLMDGLITAVDHDAWYIRRKIVDSAFYRNQLHDSIDAFNCTGDQLVAELQKYADSGEECSLAELFQYTTVDVIMKTMFSIDATDLGSDFHKTCVNFVNETFSALQLSLIPFIEYNPIFYNHTRKTRKLIKSFRDIGANLISTRKSAICNDEVVPSDLLTTMVRAHLDPSTGYDFETLVDEFVTMIAAGMETTSNTLAFVFMELGRRPDLVERLLAEVDDVVGQKSFVSSEDISRLSFSSMLIKETLRRHSIAPAMFRHCRRETTIDGVRLPAGSEVMLLISAANNDERYVENPELFNPDRFGYQEEKRKPFYSFLSFGIGPRNCIGQVFAQMEMKVVVAKFFQHFTFS